jgi:carboxyl-terminal processing protease
MVIRRQRWLGMVLAVLCLVTIAPRVQGSDKEDEQYYELMKLFIDSFEQIERNYVKEVDKRKLMEAAIRGMTADLDQYTSYISPDELARFNQVVEQEFGGIGIQVHIDPETKRLTVMTPLPGTPAYKAGMRAGDTIMEVEGKSTEGFTLEQAVKLLKGKPGEAVTLGIRHAGSNKIEQIKVVRDVIQVSTVLGDKYGDKAEWDYLLDHENKIAYIRLTHFSRRSTDEMAHALEALKSQGMKGLILDLRFNPGGLLSQATEIADLFIESGTIVSTKGRSTPERVTEAKAEGTYSGFPMAVLVNQYSASASEIVSACLQDHKRATIIGERTWGKGSVQNVIELEEGHSALKLTTASYHRPSGKNIHKFPDSKDSDEWGVKPDEKFELKLPIEEWQKYLDYRRDRDVLQANGPPKSDFKDRQLEMALNHLREQIGAAKATEQKPEAPKAEQNAKEPALEKAADAKAKESAAGADKPQKLTLTRTAAA